MHRHAELTHRRMNQLDSELAAFDEKQQWLRKERLMTLIVTLVTSGVFITLGSTSVVYLLIGLMIILLLSGFYKHIPHIPSECSQCMKAISQKEHLEIVSTSEPDHWSKLSYRPKMMLEKRLAAKTTELWLRLVCIASIFLSLWMLGPYALYIIIFSGAAWLAARQVALLSREALESNILLTADGICLQYCNNGAAVMTPWLPWSCIEHVNFLKSFSAIFDDRSIEIQYSPKNLSLKDRNKWMYLPKAFRARYINSQLYSFEIKMDGLASPEERRKLRMTLEHYLPKDRLNWREFAGQLAMDAPPPAESPIRQAEKARKISYTELWLDSLTGVSRRARSEPLSCGESISNSKYTIVETLGTGGQGTAYSAIAHDQDGGTLVVLKEFVLPSASEMVQQRALDHIERESKLLAGLDHPQIVKRLDFFTEDQRAYLVLEKINGESLRSKVEQTGPFGAKKVLQLALQMTDILTYLHGLSPAVVHRDFTPENLILERSGKLKLLDFNVAQQLESTSTRTVVGKHSYIPPEQFRGKATMQSDVYALGATLYFLLTGEDPEPISSAHPRQRDKSVSVELNELVARATEPAAENRYASAAAVKDALLALTDCKSRKGARRRKSSA